MSTHSKYKNTGILYEMIIHKLTDNIIRDVDTSPVLKIIREHFQQNTELAKELGLYYTILESAYDDKQQANDLISETVKQYDKLDRKQLKQEKYQLVNSLKEYFDIDEFMQIRVDKYKEFASIHNLFENYSNSSNNITPDLVVKSKKTLIEHITNSNRTDTEQEMFEDMDEKSRKLAYKLLTERFNKKYSSLTESQQEILNTYINNYANNVSLKNYVNEQIPKIRSRLSKLKDVYPKGNTQRIKLDEITNDIDTFLSGNIINENHIYSLLNYYEIINVLEQQK